MSFTQGSPCPFEAARPPSARLGFPERAQQARRVPAVPLRWVQLRPAACRWRCWPGGAVPEGRERTEINPGLTAGEESLTSAVTEMGLKVKHQKTSFSLLTLLSRNSCSLLFFLLPSPLLFLSLLPCLSHHLIHP